MTGDTQRRTELTRYLLGQVSQEVRDQIEDRYLPDDEFFEDLITAENDLIDDYVYGRLSGAEKEQFERGFLSDSERRERVEFAKSLMRLAGISPATLAEEIGVVRRLRPAGSTLALRWALVAGSLTMLAGLAWLAVANGRLQGQLEAVRAEQSNTQRQEQQLRQQVSDLQQAMVQAGDQATALPTAGSARLSLMLVPGPTRGSGRQVTLQLSPGISQVVLLLKREGDEASALYNVVVETAEGRQVWQKQKVQGQPPGNGGNMISIEIPPSILQQDDYVLRLLLPAPGGKPRELGVYSFRVLRP